MRRHEARAGGLTPIDAGGRYAPRGSTGRLRSGRWKWAAPACRRAFTLVELMVGMAVMSVLLVGLASAVVIASRSLPGPQSRLERTVRAAAALDGLLEDLRLATWFLDHTDTATTFAVPDRNGDGRPEWIRYAWSGTPGDPLTRQISGGAVATVLTDVRQFSLALLLRTTQETFPGAATESPTLQLLAGYPVVPTDPLNDPEKWTIDHLRHVSQYVEPTLPPGAVAWRPARVRFLAGNKPPDTETLRVELREPGVGIRPSTVTLAGVSIPENTLRGLGSWFTVDFNDVARRSPEAGVCICFRGLTGSGSPAAELRYDDQARDRNGSMTFSNNGGSSWAFEPDYVLQHEVRGYWWLQGPPIAASRRAAASVIAAVSTGDAPSGRASASAAAALLNGPELLSGIWEADFSVHPCEDRNGDGIPDFGVSSGMINPASLVNGVWRVDNALQTLPANDFAGLTIVKLRFRATSGALSFRLHADWDALSCAVIEASVVPDGQGGQTLRVSHRPDWSTEELLTDVRYLPPDFVELRLLIDPQRDLVNIRVNEIERGTFGYARIAMATADKSAVLYPEVPGAGEVDDLSIRVAEVP